jgi:superfamily II helicase
MGLPIFSFDAAPRAQHCERCGESSDLRFVIVRGRDRYAGRTLCDTCAEEVLETLVGDETDGDLSPSGA